MTNRTILILFAGGLLLVGGTLWTVALTLGPVPTSISGAPSPASEGPAQAASSTSEPRASSGVTTLVDSPAEKLKRAQHILEPPLSRDTINAAKRIIANIPASNAEYKEGQKLIKEAEARLISDEAAEAVRLRDGFQTEYRQVLSEASPHLNYIKTALTKHKSGFALWGLDEYFSQYTFSIGGDAKVVSEWIDQNHANLKKAGILRVGVKSSEGWGGSCWFEV